MSAKKEFTVLLEKDLREYVLLDIQMVEIIESALSRLNDPKVVMPPILHMALDDLNAEMDIKTAFLPGVETFAVKIGTGFFNNLQFGIPSLSGLMILIDAQTGVPKCLLNDYGYLTDIRTAAAGSVAAKYGANSDSKIATVVGTGLQARLQTIALTLVLPKLEKIYIWGRNVQKAKQCVMDIKSDKLISSHDLHIEVGEDLKSSVQESTVVVTTTSSREPLITKEMLHPGLHITAMGSDAAGKKEIEVECLSQCKYVADKLSQTELLGELQNSQKKNIKPLLVEEICEVIKKGKNIRESISDITLFDLTGTGIQDTAIANHAFSLSLQKQFGVKI